MNYFWNKIDRKLFFSSHIKTLCTKACQKLCTFSRILNWLDQDEKNLLYRSIIRSEFKYCGLVWLFCPVQVNNWMNRLQDFQNFQILSNSTKKTIKIWS